MPVSFEPIQFDNLPHRENSVDEAMVLFKGRSGFKQYMPNKPVKRGYKVWMRADAQSGYCCNFEVYTGATPGAAESGLGASVVKTWLNHSMRKDTMFFMTTSFLQLRLQKIFWRRSRG